jgi:ATP-dependent protease HslVU (ClpYQ) peptidase subunit
MIEYNLDQSKLLDICPKGDNMNKYTEQALAALGTYGRAFLAAATALYMTGNTNPKDLIAAGVAAVAPVILKALSPSNQEFGFKK